MSLRQLRNSITALLLFPFLMPLAPRATAGTLSGSFNAVATGSNVNLTAAGPLDWVHWGLYTETSVNRKDGVVPQISDFTVLDASNGFAYVYQYTDNANGYSWSDGAPMPAVTNTTTGVWAYGVPAIGSGFQITAPASTSLRTLKVFVGVFAAQGHFEASLSDGSAPNYTEFSLINIRNGPGRVYTLQYAANSAGQTLRIRWTLLTTRAADGNVTLQAAALSAVGANNPPLVTLTNPANYASFAAPATIDLGAKASDLDGTISKVEFFEASTKLGEASVSPYHYAWNNVPKGRHFLSAVATDNGGETSTSPPVEIFVYGTGGSLTGSVALPPTTLNLTTEGTADWVHWGLSSPSSSDRKSSITQKIGNLISLGTNPVQRFADNHTAFSWSDGTPTTNASNTPTGVFVTGVTNGFQFTLPADTTPRRLKVYAGCYAAQATFEAFLGDFSAPPYLNTTTLSNFFGSSSAVFTLDYTAASAGQTLTVIVRSAKLFDLDYGNVTLASATLQGGPPEPLPVHILNPTRVGNDFIFSFASQTGRTYSIQYTPSLNPIDWQPLTSVPGTGATVSITNQNVTATQRFYRVETQ